MRCRRNTIAGAERTIAACAMPRTVPSLKDRPGTMRRTESGGVAQSTNPRIALLHRPLCHKQPLNEPIR